MTLHEKWQWDADNLPGYGGFSAVTELSRLRGEFIDKSIEYNETFKDRYHMGNEAVKELLKTEDDHRYWIKRLDEAIKTGVKVPEMKSKEELEQLRREKVQCKTCLYANKDNPTHKYYYAGYHCIRFEDVPLRPWQKENDYCRNKPPTVTGGDLDPCEGYEKAI